MPILVAYATRYGSTREVAEVVAESLRDNGLAVDLAPIRDVRSPASYDAVVLGAPLYMFRWHKDARRFLSRHRPALMERSVAIFAPGPVHDPHDEKEWRDSQAQLDKELANHPWLKPVAVEIVGGRFDPTRLRFPINVFAGQEPASDIRDWDAIRAWARELAGALRQSG
jgi:menaquinone-dependent protoporphyrinogen oxidase